METFIRLIAQDLIHRFGTNLRDVTVVFPNKRAGLFMNQQLAAVSGRPVWAPRYRTISELFDSLSDFTRCDDILAVCELHRVYAALLPDPESLDRFYGWGEIMLSDFDDIDKHLADPHKLFSNIQSIKELDHSDFLTPRQEEALKHFFEDFSIEGNSRLKEKFLALWNRMDDIYATFNARLKEKGMLYEGALYKDVAEHLAERADRIPADMTYVFVGFNVLNDVEKRLFSYLQECGQALFYWDYDVMYVVEKSRFEAGTFIRQEPERVSQRLGRNMLRQLQEPAAHRVHRHDFGECAGTLYSPMAGLGPHGTGTGHSYRTLQRILAPAGAPFAARCHITASRETHQHHYGIPHDRHAGVQFHQRFALLADRWLRPRPPLFPGGTGKNRAQPSLRSFVGGTGYLLSACGKPRLIGLYPFLARRLGRSVRTTKRPEGRRVQPVVPRSTLSCPSGH
ncbi:MAG: hypothetical protein ACLR8S_02810 [Paraprevotella clara]